MAAERIILKGRSETLKPIITEILALHQLIHDRDIGEFCGYPLDEYVRAKPQRFKLKIVFYSVQSPPWRSLDNSELVRATYHVPFVQRSKIDWQTIKTACGGATGYMWGRFLCNANVQDDEGNIRKMQVYGATGAEAEQRLKALLTLTDGQILTLNITEEQREGRRAADKKLYKESTRVYPAHFTIIHQEKIVTESNIPTLSGNYRRTKFRIPLWTATKPPDADEKILEALRVRGSSTTT
jgi:hypothetical protein